MCKLDTVAQLEHVIYLIKQYEKAVMRNEDLLTQTVQYYSGKELEEYHNGVLTDLQKHAVTTVERIKGILK